MFSSLQVMTKPSWNQRGLVLFIDSEAVPAVTQRISAREISTGNSLCGLSADQLLFALRFFHAVLSQSHALRTVLSSVF